jgi:hypothetical protein
MWLYFCNRTDCHIVCNHSLFLVSFLFYSPHCPLPPFFSVPLFFQPYIDPHSFLFHLTPYCHLIPVVRGTPTPDASDSFPSGPAQDASDGFLPGALDTPAPIHPTVQPSGTSVCSCWHVLCDQARDHCRYLRTCATG